MNALITGGAGFIGSHLAHSLCEQGVNVTIIDDLSQGSLTNLSWRESRHALEFVHASVTDASALRSLVSNADWVFHLAAQASVAFSVNQPREAHQVNLNAALELLLLCRETNIKRFVFASSSAVYGDAGDAAIRENTPVCPLSPYGLQKFASETYARMFYDLYNVPTVSLRFFNVFGPRQSFSSPYSGVIAKFCTAFVNDETPRIFGDGLQSRDFIFITDIVKALELAAKAPAKDAVGKVFNIGAGKSVTLLDLLNMLRELSGRELKWEFLPAREGDIRKSLADIRSAEEFLGFTPQVGLFEGLWETFEYYQLLSDKTPQICANPCSFLEVPATLKRRATP